ncbi:MAG: GNAT family N-acetyltransferase [Thermoguttaceae bacterium]
MNFTIRPFVNADPPRLLNLLKRAVAAVKVSSINEMQEGFFGLPYNDHRGVFVAVNGADVIGFALCGLAPRTDGCGLDPDRGIIRLVVVDPEVDDPQSLAAALIERCERELFERGVKAIIAGVYHSCMPFFMGLFGLIEESNAAECDSMVYQAYCARGFLPDQPVQRFVKNLTGYRPKFTAKVVRQRSALDISYNDHPKPRHWWEACLMAYHQWIEVTAYRADSIHRDDAPVGRVTVCVSIPHASKAFYTTPRRAGIIDVYVEPEFRRQGVTMYLLGETLRFLAVECQVQSVAAYVADEFEPLISLLEHAEWKRLAPQSLLVKTRE